MSVFKGHDDLSLNRYYYSFYSFSQSDPNTIKSFVYDQNQTLISSQDISFNSRNVPAMLTFLENSQVNPYALGKSNDEYLNMDIAFAGLYKKALSQKQQQTLMTSINKTYKNVYYGTVKTFTVQVQPSSADSSIPVFILNQNTNDENPNVMVGTVGLYIFDQSDPSNANYPLAFRNIGTATPYTTNVTVEGTPGTPNSYTLITIDNVSSRMNVEYYTTSTESNADSISGELFNSVYQVHVVNNVFGDPVFSIQSPGESAFVEQPDLSFNSGDFALFYVGDTSMEPYNLVFGTTIDDNTSVILQQFYSETEDGIITLDLTNGYTEGPVYYFEDTSAGMGYVSPYSNIVARTVLISEGEDFNNTSVLDEWGKNVSYFYNYTLAGVGDPFTFVNGDYDISQSDFVPDAGAQYHKYLHRVVNNSGDSDGHAGYDWHTNENAYQGDSTLSNFGEAISSIYTNGVRGSWIQMKMPYKMNVKKVEITGRSGWGRRNPKNAHLFGWNDNGSTFDHIGDISFNNINGTQTETVTSTSSNTDSYELIRMVVSSIHGDKACHIDYWALIGDVYEFVEPEVNTYIVEVSNNAFWIQIPGDNGLLPKPVIDLTNISIVYIFDQSDSSNIGNQLVIGTTPDISSSIVSSNTTTMGTPGQPGAYTKYVSDGSIVYYFSYQNENMGEEPLTYTVKVVNHEVTDKPVFSIKAHTPVDASFIVQPNISFGAGDKYQFDIRDQTMTDFSLVFGTTVDGVPNESVVIRDTGSIILDLTNYSDGQLFYYEDSSAGMGYVPSSSGATQYTVEVANNAFWIVEQAGVLVEKAPISFNSGTTYLFDQSHSSNAGNTLVIGTNVDLSSSIISEGNVLTIMGTPGLPGAYTQYSANRSDVVYFSYQNENMGEELLTYTVRVENHEVTGNPVFSIKAPTPVDASFIVQPDLSFGAGDKYQFDIRDQTMTDFSLVFGTTVDNIGTVNESIVSRYDGTIILGISPSYNNSNGRFLYFEDSSAGMGYVPASSGATQYTVEVYNNAFWIQRPQDSDLVEKAPISFNSGTTYLFDQSHSSNAGNTLVIGTDFDVSTSIIPDVSGLTIMGTPGQPGAYTQYNANRSDVVYFSYQNETMGYLVPYMISISNTSVYPGGFTTITVKNNFDIDGSYTLILTNITQSDLSNADLSGSIPRNTETIFTYNIPNYVTNIGSFTYSIDGTDISSVVQIVELPPVNKYNVDVSDNSYWLQKFDSVGPLGANYQQPALPIFMKNVEYEFHYDDTIGHPFALSTTLNGTGTEYTSGVTRENEGTSSAVLKLTATENVSLNYYCKKHSNYGNDGGLAQYVTYLEQMTLHIKFDDGDMGNLNYNGNNPYNTITNHGTNTNSDIHLLRPPHRNVDDTISAIEDPTTDAYTGSIYIRYSPLTKIDTSDKKHGTGSLYTAYDNGFGTGNTEYIQITNPSSLVSNDPESTAYTGTFMVWFKRASDSRLLDQDCSNPFFTTYSSNRGFRINIDRDRDLESSTYNIYFVQLYEDAELKFLTDDPAPGENFGKIKNWNHYAFTSKVVDGGTHNVTIYLNGTNIKSKNVSNSSVNRSEKGFYNVEHPWNLIHPNWQHYYKGHIDDVRFYDECLPDSEITRVYNETK